ncbi:MAG: hypothetical protein LRZ93_04190, partial [Clostridiales bacterium]|nr:hypothetical protein [Clostridiales bacterium]
LFMVKYFRGDLMKSKMPIKESPILIHERKALDVFKDDSLETLSDRKPAKRSVKFPEHVVIKMLCIFLLLLFLTGCKSGGKNSEQEKEKNTPPKLPEVLAEMEMQTLEIIHIIDSVTGVEKSIVEKNKAKEDTEVPLETEEKDTTAKDKIDIQMLIINEAIITPVLKKEEIESDFVKKLEVWFLS